MSDIFAPKNMNNKENNEKTLSKATQLFAEGEEFLEKLEDVVEKEMKTMFEKIKSDLMA